MNESEYFVNVAFISIPSYSAKLIFQLVNLINFNIF